VGGRFEHAVAPVAGDTSRAVGGVESSRLRALRFDAHRPAFFGAELQTPKLGASSPCKEHQAPSADDMSSTQRAGNTDQRCGRLMMSGL
jgi:hypothetical protein